MSGAISPMRIGKTYTLAQAARLAETTAQNVRRWMYGYVAPGHRMKPVFGPQPEREGRPEISFLQLAELIVVARYRKRGGKRIPLERLRQAHDFARTRLQLEYPFASDTIRVSGAHVIHEFEESHPAGRRSNRIAIDVGGHYELPWDIRDTLELFDFDPNDSLALRFYPLGRDSKVVIDPEHAAGLPTIAGTNVRLETIVARWRAGQLIAELEADFEIPRDVLEAALQAA